MSEVLIHDVDAHEMIPGHLLGDFFGDAGRTMGRLYEVGHELNPDPTEVNMYRPDVDGDTMEVTSDTVWKVRGPDAPSAIDLSRRVEVMDAMGVHDQIVFPTTAIGAMMVGNMAESQFVDRWGADPKTFFGKETRQEFSARFLRVYNEWVASNPVQGDGRVRLAGIVPTSDNINEMLETAKFLISSGVRVLYFQADAPPGGVSPANSAMDPIWELLESENVLAALHIGSEYGFVDPRWAFAEVFQDMFQSPEVPNNDIKTFATLHFAIDNYLMTMVLGGVFERFPNLRLGIFEIAAHWVGSAVRRMDMWVDVFPGSSSARLPLKPSEYVLRNIRISPFHFEPVDRYIQQDPFMADLLCYSSDYPHLEGGKNSLATMRKKIDPLGEEVQKKFFQTNAEWILT